VVSDDLENNQILWHVVNIEKVLIFFFGPVEPVME
jgi:hypothetical protein